MACVEPLQVEQLAAAEWKGLDAKLKRKTVARAQACAGMSMPLTRGRHALG